MVIPLERRVAGRRRTARRREWHERHVRHVRHVRRGCGVGGTSGTKTRSYTIQRSRSMQLYDFQAACVREYPYVLYKYSDLDMYHHQYTTMTALHLNYGSRWHGETRLLTRTRT